MLHQLPSKNMECRSSNGAQIVKPLQRLSHSCDPWPSGGLHDLCSATMHHETSPLKIMHHGPLDSSHSCTAWPRDALYDLCSITMRNGRSLIEIAGLGQLDLSHPCNASPRDALHDLCSTNIGNETSLHKIACLGQLDSNYSCNSWPRDALSTLTHAACIWSAAYRCFESQGVLGSVQVRATCSHGTHDCLCRFLDLGAV